MAKAAKQTDIEDQSNVTNLSNIQGLNEIIVQSAKDLAEIDGQRKDLNEQAGDIRKALKEKGVDTDAFKDAYGYFKKRRREREGYDEAHKICFEALNKADTGDLFAAAG